MATTQGDKRIEVLVKLLEHDPVALGLLVKLAECIVTGRRTIPRR